MKALKYKKAKNNMYEIYFDNGSTIKVYDDIILKHEILTKQNITEKDIRKIEDDSEILNAYYTALRYISIKMRTSKEIKSYLYKKDFSTNSINYTIERLEKEKYLDNTKYIKAYIHDSIQLTLYGPEKILHNLKDLGIDENEAKKELEKIDESLWNEKINKIVSKKYSSNKNSVATFKNKTYSYLVSIGYTRAMIIETLENFEFRESQENFIKDAEKIWNKLNKKYDDEKIIPNFKNKMLLKGYNYELINEFLQNKKEN